MKNLFRAIALLLLLCATAFSAEYRPGVLLVKYRPGTDDAAIAELQQRKGMTLTKKIKLFGIYVYSFDEAKGTPVFIAEDIAREAIVLNAEPDLIREAKSADPEYPNQWSLHNTGQLVNGKTGPAGIDIRWPGANLIYRPKSTLLVAVVDSGVTLLHPDLVASIHAKPGENGTAFNNGLDDDDNGLIDDVWGYDWYSLDPLPLDQNGHGTLVASIIGGTIGNGKGISGITNSVEIRSFRTFDQFGRGGLPKFRTASGASISDSLAAIATAVEDGCKILNLSYGGMGYSQLEADAYHELGSYDVLLIVAAGNEANHNDQTPTYPASYQAACIISVAAQDRTGGLASFSNYGPVSTDLAAPGTDIRGADVTRRTIYSTGFSSGMSGWSAYRNTATDYSYAAWTTSGGYLVDRTYGQTYAPWTDTFARSPLIDASAYSGVRVEYEGMYDLSNDRGSVDLSLNGSSWESYRTFTSSGEGFDQLDASDYDFSKFYLRFRLQSDGYSQGLGIAVQGVKVTAINDLDVNNPSYQYNSGTSFAAPVVAGVAAMVWTHQPALTAAQVKEILLKSVRRLPQLDGKVLTGGMVDAEAALKLADVYAGEVMPAVVTPPAGGSFLQGNALTLSVVATPGLPVTYQWRKNGVNISGARSATFTIGVLEISDSGSYDVAITSQAGTVVSGAAQVTVAAKPPGFAVHPVRPAVVMVAGEAYQLSCAVVGTPPFAYQWLRNGVAIAGATNQSLSFAALKATDAGSYSVRVANSAGSAISQAVAVAVATRPAFGTNLPVSVTVLTGATRTLAVTATGVPLPTFQWRKDGIDIPNARLASYLVPATVVPTTATYSVVITNSAGSVESTVCQLTSVSLVSVPASGQPQARNLKVGDAATFTVTPQGTGPFTYQWLKNGIVIAGATSQSYTIASVSSADAAAYSVRVSNGAGTTTSLAAALSVLGFRTDLPATATVLTGATRTLSVVATGTPLPTFQWRKDGVDILNARLATYVVPATVVPTTATYSVMITNSTGSVESTVCQLTSVSLVSVPTSGQPQPRNLKAGDPATFAVTPAGTGPFTYQWLKNGIVIAGATSQSYTIASVSSADVAAYSVRVSNGAGTVTSAAASLSVLGFKANLPATATVLTGATRTLTVAATGVPLPTYQWRKDGVDIPNARLSSYVVPATTVPTTATYSVVITNSAGSVESTPCELTSLTLVTVPLSGQPQARNLKVGDPATFTVTPAGSGPFTYQWLKNGVVIAGATSQTYTIASVAAVDAGAYSVRVSNGAGTATSLAATLSVLGFRTDLPATATVLTGATRTLAVVATGSPLPTYQWRKDGVDIPNARAASYVVPATLVPTTASYSVVIANSAGSLVSTVCTLSSMTAVTVPISGQPQARNVVAGQSASFTVTPVGSGPFTFQWLKNGVVIAGATSQAFTIGSASAADAAAYSARVSNGASTTTSLGGILKVIAPFTVTGQPNAAVGTMALAAGTSKALTVTVSGVGPFTYQWRKDGQPIAGATLASYLVQAGTAVGSAVYDVLITGPVSATSSSAVRVDTVLPPGFLQHPVSIARALGQPAIFSVSLSGTGPFTYQWLRNGVIIAGATGPTFDIVAVKTTDAANYAVRVTGRGGVTTSLTGTLSLHAAPALATQPSNQYKAVGQSVIFSVTATGTGPLSYQWSKDGVAIPGANSSSYYIASTSAGEVGRYSVSVSNAVGSVLSQEAELAIATTPVIRTQPSVQPFVPKLPQEHRVRYFGFKDGPEGWSVSTTQAEYEDEWGAPAWYWNSYLDEIPADPLAANLQGGFGGVVSSPRVSLSGITNAELRFKCMAAGTGLAPDPGTLTIEASVDGTTWTPLFSKSNDSAITSHVVSLSAFAGNGCYIRAVTSAECGAYLDEVEFWGFGMPSNSATLTVDAAGGGLTYQWLKNGVAIAGANQAQYVVADVYATGAPGTYSVRVTNAAGTVTSGPATLGVLPGISTQPVALSKAAGQSALFSVAAVGTGPLSYQWRKDGVSIAGATGPSYSIAAVGSQHVGSYGVLVFNNFGQVTSQSVPLNVVTAPFITSQPQSYAYSYPANARADVVAYRFTQGPEGWSPVGEGYPGWMWNDQSLPSEGNDPDASSLEGNGYVRSPLISLAGLTSCSVDFDINAYGGNCNLDVSVDGANWSTVYTYDGSNFGNAGVKTVDLSAYDGRSVYLRFYMPTTGAALLDDIEVSGVSRGHVMSVGVSGAGCTYQWFRNGIAIAGATSTSYRVSDVALAVSAGSYTVRVTNAAGTVTSVAAVIPVFPKPVIVSQPASLSVQGPVSTPYTVKNYTFNSGAEGWTYGSYLGNQSPYNWAWDSAAGAITDRLYGASYTSYTDTYTQSPWISLLGVSSPMLYFTAYHELFPDSLDALDVQASSDGVYWTTLRSIYGNGNGVYSVSLAGYQWSGCYLRYRLRSSPLYNAFGVVIYDTVVSGSVVSLGQAASFSVGLSSAAGCTFQWYKNNVAIPGANSSTYYIANCSASDAGAYKVVVTNPVGSVTSNSATLTVR